MASLSSFQLIELAVLPPGQSHYWFFDPPGDLHGCVLHATAHPEPADDADLHAQTRVEVSELFVVRNNAGIDGNKRGAEVNITVTNYTDRWAPYSLWLVCIRPRSARGQARRSLGSSNSNLAIASVARGTHRA